MREAWRKIQIWYQEAKVCQATPTREGLEHTSTLREDLYRWLPPEGYPIPILLQPVSITGGPLEGEDLEFAVRKIRSGREGGPSVMKSEHLNTWLR